MKENVRISRRNLLGLTACSLTAICATPSLFAETRIAPRVYAPTPLVLYTNEHFYNDGKFDEDKARDAIIELAKFHGYPITQGFREKLWVSDYGIGRFTEVGLSAIGIVNNLDGEYSFMLQDLFMLPNQMLPEHWHVEVPEAEKKTRGAQKDEGWYIRWGRSYVIGEGNKNLPPEVSVPKSHGPVTVEHCTVADAGTFVKLTKRGSRHWQFAGQQGVILTEVANYNDNASVRHTNKTANDHFLAGIK
jgi:D-lyxose ketol-isomerase